MKARVLYPSSFKRYVLGFMFSPNGNNVLLIRKSHPDWQAGLLLNGIGGKLKLNEPPLTAMHREFQEETGINTDVCGWDCRLILSNHNVGYVIWIFSTFTDQIQEALSITDEIVIPVPVSSLKTMDNVIPNLKWMIPMLLDRSVKLAEVKDGGNR